MKLKDIEAFLNFDNPFALSDQVALFFINANDFNVSSLFENIQINGWSHTDHTGLSGADLTERINQMASGGIGGFGPKYFSISALLRLKAFFVKSHSRVGRFRITLRRRSTRFCQYL